MEMKLTLSCMLQSAPQSIREAAASLSQGKVDVQRRLRGETPR